MAEHDGTDSGVTDPDDELEWEPSYPEIIDGLWDVVDLLATGISYLDLPRIAKPRAAGDMHWRTRLVRAALDLIDDAARGEWPQPRCTGEEIVLHLGLNEAAMSSEERLMHLDVLYQDADHELLYMPELDGIENDREILAAQGIGDVLHPDGWFTWFNNCDQRPGYGAVA